eukprot:154873-Prymnesium_polylepis.1
MRGGACVAAARVRGGTVDLRRDLGRQSGGALGRIVVAQQQMDEARGLSVELRLRAATLLNDEGLRGVGAAARRGRSRA